MLALAVAYGLAVLIARDPLDGVDGTTTVANGYHYADNDPLNKTDLLGLRAQDCNFSQDGTCPVVVNDVDPGRRAATIERAPMSGPAAMRALVGVGWSRLGRTRWG